MSSLYIDTSALVALHIDHPQRAVVADAMRASDHWFSSAVTIAESTALIDRVLDEPVLRRDLEDLVRLTWDRIAVVPVDQRCLNRAAVLMRSQPLRIGEALHLAATDRLPHPVLFATFDPAQIPVALALGMEVVSA